MERSTAPRTGTSEGVRGQSEVERERKARTEKDAGRTVAQTFCIVGGLTLVAVGILGFFFGGDSFNTGTNVQGEEFIAFEVNGWHNVVHIATGAFLLLMAATARAAITGAVVFGLAYLVVTIWGFVDGSDVVNLIPVNTADNILHLTLTAAALLAAAVAAGLLAKGERDRPGTAAAR